MARYLIADDNIAFAENLAEILEDAGDEAVVVDSGARALDVAENGRFDAVISDWRMPRMTGTEVVQRLRVIDPQVPAILVTAYTADADLDEARHAGLLGVLPKPVPVAKLLKILSGARRNGVVALVDDDAALVDNLSEVLRDHGFSPVVACSVAETERLVGIAPFAAIADLRVPGGEDGAAMKRLAERFPGVPIIVMTGHHTLATPLEPAARFEKPFDPRALLSALEALHRGAAAR